MPDKPEPSTSDMVKEQIARDRVEQLGKRVGNVSLAAAMLSVDQGIVPEDDDKRAALLEALSAQSAKAVKTYLRLDSTIGRRLKAAHADWREFREREARVFAAIVGSSFDQQP